MCRRRFFKSYLYINYGGTAHGEAVDVSPFVAGGGSDTIELVSGRPWAITNNTSWLTVSSLSNKSGTYSLTLTAGENPDYSIRTGSFTAKTLDNRHSVVVSVSQAAKPSEKYIFITPTAVTMNAVDTYNYLKCYLHYNGADTEVTPNSWTDNSSAVTISAAGVVTSNNTGSNPVTATATATYVHGGDTLTATAQIRVSAATINEWVELSPNNFSVPYGSGQTLTVVYVKSVNGVETRTPITNASQLTFTLSDTTSASMNGMNLMNRNETDANKPITVSVAYNGINSNTVSGSMLRTSNITYRLDVTVDSNNIAYCGQTNAHATYVTVVNGNDYSSVQVTPSGGWSVAPTTYASISSAGLITANNDSSADTRTITVTGVHNGATGTTQVTIGKKPGIRVTVTPSSVSSGAGSCTYTVYWTNLKQNSTIVLSGVNLSTYSPTAITINSSNYTGGSSTISASFAQNSQESSRDLYLYASGTSLYGNQTLTGNAHCTQAGHTPVITYELVVSPTAATLNYDSTTALSVIYYVITDGVPDAGTNVKTTATYTNTGSNSSAITVSQGDVRNVNTGLTQEVVTFTVSYGNAAPVNVQITANQATRTKRLTVTPASSTIAATGTTTMSAVYEELIGTQVVYTENPNSTAVTWAITDGGAYATISTAGTVTGTNNTETAHTVTVRGTYKSVSDTDTINVQGKEHVPVITYELVVSPTAATLNYDGTTALTVTYYVVTDGVRDAGTNVKTTATYTNTGSNSTAITVSQGNVRNVNTGLTQEVVTFSVKYGQAPAVNVQITANQATRTKRLTVTPASSTISETGSTTMSAVYEELIGTQVVYTETPARTAVTWAITVGSAYATVSTGGTVTGRNGTTTAQTVTVRGTYKSVSDTDNITVQAHVPTITYELVVSPTAATLNYNGTTALSVTYYVVTDGVRDAGTNVKTTATYTNTGSNSTAITVSQGNVRNVNTGLTQQVVTFSVKYGQAPAVNVQITANPATRTKRLTVTPGSSTISETGTTTMSAVYEELIDGQVVYTETPNNTAVTWSITAGSAYASISSNGIVTGTNITETTQTVTVLGTYKGVSDDANITVQAHVPTITYELVVSPTAATLNYDGTTSLTVTYYVIRDGVRDSGTNVKTTATYTKVGSNGSAITVSQGDIRNVNTGRTTEVVTITVSYGEAPSVNVQITANPATRMKQLVVTAADSIISSDGTTTVSAVYNELINGQVVYTETPVNTSVTWSIINGGSYATIANNGTVTGTNSTQNDQIVTIQGIYNGATGSTTITVSGKIVPQDCNFSLSYEGQNPVSYSGDATFKLYYGNDINVSSIGAIEEEDYIDEISLVGAGTGEMNVNVVLSPNCDTESRKIPFTLSARCGNNTVYATSPNTVEQAHQEGYPVTVYSANTNALIINNTSQDIYLNGLQVYSRNDCGSVNLYQFYTSISGGELIPANTSKSFPSSLAATARTNDTLLWGQWMLSNAPSNSYTTLRVGSQEITAPGTGNAVPIISEIKINPNGSIILQIRVQS